MMKRLVALVALGVMLGAVCQLALPNEEEQFIYNSHGKRNPFVPLLLPAEETPTPTPMVITRVDFTPTPTPVPFPYLEPECILWSEGRSLVVIDNALLNVGDVVEECEIVEINPDSIRVRFMGQEKVFRPSAPTSTGSKTTIRRKRR